jgi:uncharacterized protein YjbJ (UPF0337 family)
MNETQIKGTAKDIAGKVQETAGEVVGSNKQQAKGLAKQGVGKVQKNVGDARSDAERSSKDRC